MAEEANEGHKMEEGLKRPEQEGDGTASSSAQAESRQDTLTAEVESLRASLEAEKGKAEDYLKHWQRTQADFINYKRRVDQERADQLRYANTALILKVIPILDDFERAFASLPREMAAFTWLEGMALIDRKLRFILEQEGVTPIEALGKDFDPLLHEAVLFEEGTDLQHGKVVAELQKGYKLHDRVIRPAMVKVGPSRPSADGREADANEAEAKTEESTGS